MPLPKRNSENVLLAVIALATFGKCLFASGQNTRPKLERATVYSTVTTASEPLTQHRTIANPERTPWSAKAADLSRFATRPSLAVPPDADDQSSALVGVLLAAGLLLAGLYSFFSAAADKLRHNRLRMFRLVTWQSAVDRSAAKLSPPQQAKSGPVR